MPAESDDSIAAIASADQTNAAVREVALGLMRYMTALLAAGFSREEALVLVKSYQETLFGSMKGR